MAKQPKTLQDAAALTETETHAAAPATEPAPKTEERQVPPAEMSILEKVKLMSDLTSVCQDKKLIDAIKNRSNGERIFSIFISSVEREVAKIMNGKDDDNLPKEVVNLVGYTRHLQGTMGSFRDLIAGFMRTPLVQVLNMLNQNMGGKNFDFSVLNQQPDFNIELPPEAKRAQAQKPATQSQAQAQSQRRDPPPSEASGRGTEKLPGLGSF